MTHEYAVALGDKYLVSPPDGTDAVWTPDLDHAATCSREQASFWALATGGKAVPVVWRWR